MAVLTDFWIKQGDTAEAIIIVAEYDDGTPIPRDEIDGADCEVHMRNNAGDILIAAGVGSVADDPDNPTGPKLIGYQWEVGDTDEATSAPSTPHQLEFQLTLEDGRILTIPNASNISVHIFPQIA